MAEGCEKVCTCISAARDYYVRQNRGRVQVHFTCLTAAATEAKRRHTVAAVTHTEPILYIETSHGSRQYLAFMVFGDGFVRAFGLDKPQKRTAKAKAAGA